MSDRERLEGVEHYYTDAYTGRVYRHKETLELLWVTAQDVRDSELHEELGVPWIACECLCLSGPNTGRSRTLNPTYLDEQCALIDANYQHELVLATQDVGGLVAIPRDAEARENWPFAEEEDAEEDS